jgi:hypothetical protein
MITELGWKGCPKGLYIIILDENVSVVDWEGCPNNVGISPIRLYNEFQDYKKSKRYYDILTKPKRNINSQISANSVLPLGNKVRAFNVRGYKQNFYDMLDEVAPLLAPKGSFTGTPRTSPSGSPKDSPRTSRNTRK